MEAVAYRQSQYSLAEDRRARFVIIEGGSVHTPHKALSYEPSMPQRIAAGFIAALVVATVFFASIGMSALQRSWTSEATAAVTESTVTVSTGDSLWKIAESHPIDGLSTSQTKDWLIQRNALSSSTITPGQVLVVAE